MENKNDLFEQIRANQHLLNEKPSNRAWRKLERKLGQRRRHTNLYVVRALSMAAALLILVGAIFVFSNVNTHNNQDVAIAEANAGNTPMQLEELTNYPEKLIQPYRVLVQYQEKMPSRGANPKPIINEGKGKRLVVLNGKKVEKLPNLERSDSLRRDSFNS